MVQVLQVILQVAGVATTPQKASNRLTERV